MFIVVVFCYAILQMLTPRRVIRHREAYLKHLAKKLHQMSTVCVEMTPEELARFLGCGTYVDFEQARRICNWILLESKGVQVNIFETRLPVAVKEFNRSSHVNQALSDTRRGMLERHEGTTNECTPSSLSVAVQAAHRMAGALSHALSHSASAKGLKKSDDESFDRNASLNAIIRDSRNQDAEEGSTHIRGVCEAPTHHDVSYESSDSDRGMQRLSVACVESSLEENAPVTKTSLPGDDDDDDDDDDDLATL